MVTLHRMKHSLIENPSGIAFSTSYEIEGVDYDEKDDESEGLSVYAAALIWASKGKDEDYMFGYTEEELEDAL